MIQILLVFHLLINPGIDIGKINALKNEAKKAYNAGDYKSAAQKYSYLIDSLGIQEDELILNLANAKFNLNDTTGAQNGYRQLTASTNKFLKSAAYQQLGVMSTRQSKLEEALQNFREALKANPGNEEARYNYELVKKKLEEEKKKQQQNQQNKDQKQNQDKKQDKKDQQNQKDNKQNQDKKENKDQKKDQEKKNSDQKDKKSEEEKKKEDEENKDQKPKEEQDKKPNFDPDKMKQMKVTEDKAKMILEAMKRNEVQYLQQNRRKATKPKDKSKPDW
jgi:hypothetical protein